jgi:acetyltransferase-like isoleucine patch superfamily enzyme
MSYTGADTSIMWAEIGKYCAISRMVDIGGNQHNYHAASIMPLYRLQNKLGGKLTLHPEEEMITVGNDVWIGQGVSIVRKKGLVIGDGAVIGSGAVVTKSIPPYAVAAGVPARIIRYRFSEPVIERLLKLKWWDWPAEKILECRDLLTADLTEEILDELAEKAGI